MGIDRNSGIPLDSIVSMNMWGFNHSFLDILDGKLEAFLKNLKNPLKDEVYLPIVVDEEIKAGRDSVKVLRSTDKWYGVTYREDKEMVKNALASLIAEGKYPEKLF